MEDDYKYEFRYIDGTNKVLYEFSADTDVKDLVYHLKMFLSCCGWNIDKLRKEFINEENF